MKAGTYLLTGEIFKDPVKDVFLVVKNNGDVVCYRGTGPDDIKSIVWQSNTTSPKGNYYIQLETDGNLLVRNGSLAGSGEKIWETNTGKQGGKFFVTFDGERRL